MDAVLNGRTEGLSKKSKDGLPIQNGTHWYVEAGASRRHYELNGFIAPVLKHVLRFLL